MNNERVIGILKISPHIRYVNNIWFQGGDTVPERILYDHEFIFGLSGEAQFEYEGKTFKVGRSDLLYIKPNRKNTMVIEKGKTFHAHCVHFDWVPDEQFDFSAEKYYISQMLSKEDLIHLEKVKHRTSYEVSDLYIPPLIKGLEYDILAPMFRKLYDQYSQSDISAKLKARGFFINIIGEILAERMERPSQANKHYYQKTIEKTIAYLKEHYNEPIKTPDLADKFSLSPKYFGVQFKSITGLSVQEYLQNIRMQAAKKLLLNSDASLEDIAEQTGIRDVVYFIKLFKKAEGITPGRYRKMLSDFQKKTPSDEK